MPATIVQTNEAPFSAVDIDPVSLDIIENALRNARIEMDATLFRTALSPGIREQGDAFPMIADAKGRMVVGQFGSFLDGFLRGYDGTIEEGDIILLNDPYACEGAVSHLSDQLVIAPVFGVPSDGCQQHFRRRDAIAAGEALSQGRAARGYTPYCLQPVSHVGMVPGRSSRCCCGL